MLSTMQSWPLTIAAILRHACRVNGDRVVTTATGHGGYRSLSYRELGEQVAQLAHGLRGLGITGDQRVATFMWNNAEHLAVYLAAPAMGAVLHTLNIRLSAEQIAFIANEAEDQVIVADASLVGVLAPVLPLLDTVHTVIVAGDADAGALSGHGVTVLRYEDLLAGHPTEFDWPEVDENSAAAMCYTSGTTGNPKGVVYSHRSTYLHSLSTCTANALDVGSDDVVLPIVPMFHANAWGLAYAALMAGADLVMPDRFLDGASLIELIESRPPPPGRPGAPRLSHRQTRPGKTPGPN
ncbi:AMP-binding protein, partial [Mycobacterium adipatum]|uniref:AMP-binding protein n=1 Tax=Mycobacterium adipatum TaxID=1682113 RepID=UPI0034E079A3